MTAEVTSAYVQLLSAGLLWISFHCVGMCGPLVLALDVARQRAGSTPLQGAGHVILYQLGRATTYAFLGAIAGMAGAGIKSISGPFGAVAVGLMGLGMLAVAIWPRRRGRNPTTTLERRVSGDNPDAPPLHRRVVDRLLKFVSGLTAAPNRSRSFLLGALLGLMPCMITFWVLGLAATTGSPLHGAAVMTLLVVMTTPVLLGASLLPRLFPRFRSRVLKRLLLTASGGWLLLIASAGLEFIAHQHLAIELFGDHYMVMLW
ncbi:MAG: sulfite exporter TauE/SafE [Myxococcota bacterium]|jgi:sulfite exporter TauE/SafE